MKDETNKEKTMIIVKTPNGDSFLERFAVNICYEMSQETWEAISNGRLLEYELIS